MDNLPNHSQNHALVAATHDEPSFIDHFLTNRGEYFDNNQCAQVLASVKQLPDAQHPLKPLLLALHSNPNDRLEILDREINQKTSDENKIYYWMEVLDSCFGDWTPSRNNENNYFGVEVKEDEVSQSLPQILKSKIADKLLNLALSENKNAQIAVASLVIKRHQGLDEVFFLSGEYQHPNSNEIKKWINELASSGSQRRYNSAKALEVLAAHEENLLTRLKLADKSIALYTEALIFSEEPSLSAKRAALRQELKHTDQEDHSKVEELKEIDQRLITIYSNKVFLSACINSMLSQPVPIVNLPKSEDSFTPAIVEQLASIKSICTKYGLDVRFESISFNCFGAVKGQSMSKALRYLRQLGNYSNPVSEEDLKTILEKNDTAAIYQLLMLLDGLQPVDSSAGEGYRIKSIKLSKMGNLIRTSYYTGPGLNHSSYFNTKEQEQIRNIITSTDWLPYLLGDEMVSAETKMTVLEEVKKTTEDITIHVASQKSNSTVAHKLYSNAFFKAAEQFQKQSCGEKFDSAPAKKIALAQACYACVSKTSQYYVRALLERAKITHATVLDKSKKLKVKNPEAKADQVLKDGIFKEFDENVLGDSSFDIDNLPKEEQTAVEAFLNFQDKINGVRV